MKKLTALTPAALLMMLALSPLVQAGPGKGHGASRSYATGGHAGYKPTYVKPTTHHSFAKPTYHAPTYHGFAKPIHHAPTYHAPKYHAPAYHAPKYHDPKHTHYVKPIHHAPKHTHYAKPIHHAPKFVTGYAKQHGVKFSHGHYYSGKHHRHWTKRVWVARYGTWCWYCPSTTAWYYWYAPKAVYYPMSYITNAAPAVGTPQTAVVPPGGEELPEVPVTEVEDPTE